MSKEERKKEKTGKNSCKYVNVESVNISSQCYINTGCEPLCRERSGTIGLIEELWSRLERQLIKSILKKGSC